MVSTLSRPDGLYVVDESIRRAALAYIEAFMRERFGCEPPPTVGQVLVAYHGGNIVGSMAIESTENEVPFSLEKRYAVPYGHTPYPFVRARIVQGTRWTAQLGSVAEPLFRYACALARQEGKRFMLIEAKPSPVRRFAQLGIPFVAIDNAPLLIEEARQAVGDDGMRYFLESPPPRLYMLDMDAVAE